MIELGALLLVAVAVLGLLFAAGVIVKAIFWVVFLPIRLVFWVIGGLLFLPLLLLKLLGGVIFLLTLPVLAIAFGLAGVAVVISVLLPAIPLILLAAFVWYLVRPQPLTGGA
jgi:hypothetical protein